MENPQNLSTEGYEPKTAPQDVLFEKKLKLLKAEIQQYDSGLLADLEKNITLLVVADNELGKTLNADELKLIGGIAVLCRQYGVPMIFLDGDRSQAILTKRIPQPKSQNAV